MINLAFRQLLHVLYGVFRINYILIFIVLSVGCYSKHDNLKEKVVFTTQVITIDELKYLVFQIENHSDVDLCLMGTIILGDFYSKGKNDTIWRKFDIIPMCDDPIYNPEQKIGDEYSLMPFEEYEKYPEYYSFLKAIFNDADMKNDNKGELFESYLYFNSALFLKAKDIVKDTINITCFFKWDPYLIIKHEFVYPLNFKIDEIKNSFDIPESIDGYNVITDELFLNHVTIVNYCP